MRITRYLPNGLLSALVLGVPVFLGSCAATDTVANFAKKSFAEFTKVVPVEGGTAQGGWTILTPGADRFFFPAPRTAGREFRLEVDAEPFLAAGLDPNRLVSTSDVHYAVEDGKLIICFDAGADTKDSSDLVGAFSYFVAANRDRIGYHHEKDHYGIMLGGGNIVEWAGDMAKNERDLVFLLDPEPFVAAGANLEALEGWTYAQVPARGGGTTMVQVWRLIRPFNLR